MRYLRLWLLIGVLTWLLGLSSSFLGLRPSSVSLARTHDPVRTPEASKSSGLWFVSQPCPPNPTSQGTSLSP